MRFKGFKPNELIKCHFAPFIGTTQASHTQKPSAGDPDSHEVTEAEVLRLIFT